MEKISAIIICMKEEGKIRECLKSIDFVDEIIIINSGATDRTIEICKEFTDKIVYHPWPSYGQQMNYAKDFTKNEWVLSLDVNEVVSEKLKRNILSALEHDGGKYDGYRVIRRHFYLGKRINHCWTPALKICLYRKSKAQWVGRNSYYGVELKGRCRDLKGDLQYFPYQNVSQHLHAIDSSSSSESLERYEEGRSIHFFSLTFYPLFYFFRLYGLKRGFLDGMPGLIISLLESYRCFLKSVKLWELEKASSTSLLNPFASSRFRHSWEKVKDLISPKEVMDPLKEQRMSIKIKSR